MNPCSRKTAAVLVLSAWISLLSACGGNPNTANIVSSSPWPSHEPEATPFIRLKSEVSSAPYPEAEGHVKVFASEEEMIRSIYAVEGKLYFKDWELQMFKELPQEEPYDFVIRTDVMLNGGDTVEDYIRLAQQFSDLGCQTRVKEMRAVFEGQEEFGWITIVNTTPSHLWELSTQVEDWLHVEQLYPQVDLRFETQIWPEA